MKTLSKLTLIAALSAVTFTACDLIGGKPSKKVEPSLDSLTNDSLKIDTAKKDSTKNVVDTSKKAL